MVRIAYADPPYLGICSAYQHHHPDGRCWDEIETHRALIQEQLATFDRWALSLSSTTLRAILPICPEDVRVLAWCKPFARFKPGNRVAYGWEPIIMRGGPTKVARSKVHDYCVVNPVIRGRRHFGQKPVDMLLWLFDVLDVGPDDEFVDLFHGSGAVKLAHREWLDILRMWGERGTNSRWKGNG